MSTREKKTDKLEIKHYKSSHVGSIGKELITEQVEVGSATFKFIERMEEQRRQKECFRRLDMRGKVEGECKAHIFNGQTMWLDDISCKLFFEGLEKNNGVFTVETFEFITNGMHTFKGMRAHMNRHQFGAEGRGADGGQDAKAQQAGKAPAIKPNRLAQEAPPPPENFEVIPLGYFHKRREERVQRIIEIAVSSGKSNWPAKTRDLSASGLLIKVTPACQPQPGDQLEIDFTALSEKCGQTLPPLHYRVVKIEASPVENIIALALDSAEENATTRTLARYIDEQLNSGRRAHKLEMTDAILTATSMLSEHFYVQSSTCLPFFLSRAGKDELRIQALCLNEYNRQVLKHFETLPGRYDLTGLISPERVGRFYELGLQQGRDDPLIAVFRNTPEAKPQVAASFEFEEPTDWQAFLGSLRDSHQHAVLKLMLRPLQSPDPMRIVRETQALAEKSLDAAEQLIQQAQQFIASGTLVDVTREATHNLPSTPTSEIKPPAAKPQSGVTPPEIMRMGYVEKYRREDRFRHAVLIETALGAKVVRTKTRDFSVHGLSFLLSQATPGLEVGQRLEVAFPELKHQGNVLGMLKRKPPSGRYEVVGVDHGRHILVRMKLLNQEQNQKTKELLQELIDQNKGRLEVDLSESLRAAKSAYYSGLATESTVNLPVYIFSLPESSGYLLKIGLPEQPGNLAGFFEISEGRHDFSALANPLRIGKLISQLKKQEIVSTHFYLYKAQIPGEGKYKIHAKTDHEFGNMEERGQFIHQALDHDPCFAKLILARPRQPPVHEVDRILDKLKTYSAVRAKEINEQMSQLIAVGDLVDLTRQLSGGPGQPG